jgi:predicted CoA-substrate-specific enzyme activase
VAYLGVDVGSLYAGIVLLDQNGNVQKQAYVRHHGEPLNAIEKTLKDFPLETVTNVARTGSGGESIPLPGKYINAVVAGVEGVQKLDPEVRNIISIGGGSFSLTRLNDDGSYRTCTTNSACASGTGAFLDQQALRLQVDPTELAEKADRYEGTPPGVATRCAVFAKSDMIHLQQEGFSSDAIAAGLCAGLGHSTVDGLLGGHSLNGKTICIGGVSKNKVVVGSVREKLGIDVTVAEHPEMVGALGAALYAGKQDETIAFDLKCLQEKDEMEEDADTFLRAPLKLELSEYPDFKFHDYWVDENKSEIALVEPLSGTVPVILGIDIGSTSTKAALLDDDQRVVAWIYRKTAGDPIGAVQKLLDAVRKLEARAEIKLNVKGVGTTGSGRKMIGTIIGADLAINEITAHARAAVYIDPKVDTILELGGQDAKFTQLSKGVVYNSVMNYVCAAGTGSFIEEQALKLGVPIAEYADFAIRPVIAVPSTWNATWTFFLPRDGPNRPSLPPFFTASVTTTSTRWWAGSISANMSSSRVRPPGTKPSSPPSNPNWASRSRLAPSVTLPGPWACACWFRSASLKRVSSRAWISPMRRSRSATRPASSVTTSVISV